jgi:hypothetical protein
MPIRTPIPIAATNPLAQGRQDRRWVHVHGLVGPDPAATLHHGQGDPWPASITRRGKPCKWDHGVDVAVEDQVAPLSVRRVHMGSFAALIEPLLRAGVWKKKVTMQGGGGLVALVRIPFT